MAKVSLRQAMRDIHRTINPNSLAGLARGNAGRRFEAEKKKMLMSFNQDEITKEIEAGPSAHSVSNTVSRGNLFSYIGFESSSSPIDELRNLLESKVNLLNKIKTTKTKVGYLYTFTVEMPTEEEIAEVTPMPWEGGSWALKIETGISGFSQYIYNRFLSDGASRSGTGLQVKNAKLPGAFKPKPYLSKIFKTFLTRIETRR